MTIKFSPVAVLLLCSILMACGGGGAGGTGTSAVTQSESADGIWTGTTVTPGYGTSSTVAFFNGGEFIAINENFYEFYKGSYNIDGSRIRANNAKGYEVNGPYLGSGDLDGVVYSQGTLRATVNSALGNSELDLVYETAAYEQSISLADLTGSWSGSIPGLSFGINISSSGYFTASASDGCNVSGQLSIPRTNRNMITADLTISGSNCFVSGNYSGLGILVDDVLAKDTLLFGYANNNYGFAYAAYRN